MASTSNDNGKAKPGRGDLAASRRAQKTEVMLVGLKSEMSLSELKALPGVIKVVAEYPALGCGDMDEAEIKVTKEFADRPEVRNKFEYLEHKSSTMEAI